MKISLLALALCSVAASCTGPGQHVNDHWNEISVPARVGRTIMGYDATRDGSYGDYQWEKKEDLRYTVYRHFLNHNPDNPFQSGKGGRQSRPDPWSIAPNPLQYIHLEGLIVGLIAYAAGGGFIILPVDSVLTTFDEPDGISQFFRGFVEWGNNGVVTANAAEEGDTTYVTAVGS